MARSKRKLLQELEELFVELDYKVRYEKGNFQSGYCIVENAKVVVINKFFDTEGRIDSLLEILSQLRIDPGWLYSKSKEISTKVVEKQSLKLELS